MTTLESGQDTKASQQGLVEGKLYCYGKINILAPRFR